MFDKFGEFDSAEELNAKAAELKAAGEEKRLVELALENGLDKEDAEDYMDGRYSKTLATTLQAAIGKLQIETKDLKLEGVLKDWVEEIKIMATEVPGMATAIRKKGKDLAGYIALTADSGYEHRAVVDKRIVAKTKQAKKIVGSHEFSIGIPDKKTRRELAKKYYIGK
ncbi:MAG: hypothetical protein U0L24_02375 [Lachnospiraceae bacterium]|nr:hypothetical protein [Lachnospiraceae bacterium]